MIISNKTINNINTFIDLRHEIAYTHKNNVSAPVTKCKEFGAEKVFKICC